MTLSQEYEQQPLVSFEQATQSLLPIVPGIEQMIEVVKQNLKESVHSLSPDESASIMLYRLKWKTPQSTFHFILNEILRSQIRDQLSPWVLYLRLFTYALSKLPSISSHTVYRELRMDVISEYSKGEIIIWQDFVSCTSSIPCSENEMYDNESRVIFIIECHSVKDISLYSIDDDANELILSPERQFEVISSVNYGNQHKLIQLKEIRVHHPRTQISSNTIHDLESNINQCPRHSKIDLIKQGLNNADMNIVVNNAIINKQCRKLFLSDNQITSSGASIIARALNNNIHLESLSLADNNLSDEGIQSLTEILARNNCKLQTLSLHSTGITEKSAEQLANMLKKNTTLTWLHLGGNEISHRGISLLTDVLTHQNRTLKALELSHNSLITDAAVDSLVEMIKQNTSLETLWINDCTLSSKGKKKLQGTGQQSKQRFFLLFV